jgi:hypothetical protein
MPVLQCRGSGRHRIGTILEKALEKCIEALKTLGILKKTKSKALILKKIISCFHRQKLYGMRVFPNMCTDP